MVKFNNIIKWIFLIGFSTTLVMQVAGDDSDKSIVEKVNKTLGKIEQDFIDLADKISSVTVLPTIPTGKTTPKTPPTTSNNPATITTGKTTPKTLPTTSNNPATITTGKTTPKIPATTSNNPGTITTGKTTPKIPATTSNNPVTNTTVKTTPTPKPTTTKPASIVKSEDEPEAYPHVVRKKRDVLSQIWEMKMRKMRNKLVTIPPPADVKKLNDAMADVTQVTSDIVAETITEKQVTTVDVAEKTIYDIVDKADSTLLNYLKSNPTILDNLNKQAEEASDTVEKYYKENFEDDGGSNVGAIVGGVCGGVAGVGLLGFGYYYYKKRQS